MNKIKSGIIGFALAIGVSGFANAGISIPDCGDANGEINGAIVHLDTGHDYIEKLGLHNRFKGRKELRKAVVDITGARVALADCGILPVGLDLADFDFSVIDPFQLLVDLEIDLDGGNITNMHVLRAARILAEHAILESYGADDGDALNDIFTAIILLEWVQGNI